MSANVRRGQVHTVIDCSYRLSPETPFPGALNDVEDSIEYVLSQPEQFDSRHLSISGFSAGANLAMVAASTRFPGIFQSMVVFYPVTDLSIEVSERQYGPDRNVKPAVSPFLLRIFFKSYIQSSPISKKDARLSPTYAPLENFPGRNLFITAAHDNLCQEAEALAARLADLDTKKGECMRVEHCNHAFDKEPAVGSIQERMMKQAYSRVVQFLKE